MEARPIAAKHAQPSSEIFRRIPAPPRLFVPVTSSEARHPVKPSGTLVAAGELLTQGRLESEPATLAPLAGRIVGVTRVSLLNGSSADAVEIETGGDIPAPPPPSQPAPAEATPRASLVRSAEFGRWIDRLLSAGVN